MSRETRKAASECAHCRVVSATSHQAQQVIGGCSMDEPLDVIGTDIGTQVQQRPPQARLRVRKQLSQVRTISQASLAFDSEASSEVTARLALSHFFVPSGLPKLVVIDGGSKMKGALIATCKQLGIPQHQAPPEARNLISMPAVPLVFEQGQKDRSSRCGISQETGNERIVCRACLEWFTG